MVSKSTLASGEYDYAFRTAAGATFKQPRSLEFFGGKVKIPLPSKKIDVSLSGINEDIAGYGKVGEPARFSTSYGAGTARVGKEEFGLTYSSPVTGGIQYTEKELGGMTRIEYAPGVIKNIARSKITGKESIEKIAPLDLDIQAVKDTENLYAFSGKAVGSKATSIVSEGQIYSKEPTMISGFDDFTAGLSKNYPNTLKIKGDIVRPIEEGLSQKQIQIQIPKQPSGILRSFAGAVSKTQSKSLGISKIAYPIPMLPSVQAQESFQSFARPVPTNYGNTLISSGGYTTPKLIKRQSIDLYGRTQIKLSDILPVTKARQRIGYGQISKTSQLEFQTQMPRELELQSQIQPQLQQQIQLQQQTQTQKQVQRLTQFPSQPNLNFRYPPFLIPKIPQFSAISEGYLTRGGGGKQANRYQASLVGLISGKKQGRAATTLSGLEVRYPVGVSGRLPSTKRKTRPLYLLQKGKSNPVIKGIEKQLLLKTRRRG